MVSETNKIVGCLMIFKQKIGVLQTSSLFQKQVKKKHVKYAELDILNKYRVTFCWNIEHIFNSKIDMHHLNYLCLVNLNQLSDAMIKASDYRIVFTSNFHVKNKSLHPYYQTFRFHWTVRSCRVTSDISFAIFVFYSWVCGAF